MLRTVFLLVVSMSIAGSVAAAGVLLLKALLRDRLPARTGCYVWLVAIALFLLPLRQLVPGIPPSAAQSTVYNSSIINSVTLPQNTESAEPTTALQSPFRDIRTPLGVIWAAGMLLYFGAKAVSYRRFRRQILRGAMPCGKDTQDALVLAMKRTNCQSPVRLFCRVGVQTPLTFGVARPIILLPGEHIPPERLEMILTHELVHIRQHDLLYKLCSMLAAGIHWFNPFAHLMAADIDDACELRCDREVVRILGEERKKSYCELLIDTAILPCTSENGLFTASLGRRRKLIKRRVYSIMTANACRPALKAVIIACVVAASALGVACSPMVEIPDSTNVHIEDVPDVVDVSSTNDADNSTKPADDTLLCTVVEKYYTGDDPTPISVKTKTISLPTWMEEQEIGYSVESRYSGEGHTVVTYMLADVDEDANVPEWYHVQWQMTQERRLSEEPLDEINAPLVNGPIWPLPSSSVNDISAEFGSPIGHAGIDIAAELGSDVVASEQGIVVVAKYKGAYGNHLMIDHGNGLQTVYAHCDKLAVKLGDTVQAGQTIATVGQTGNAFEICLYFEVRENGECVDPQDYLSEVRYRF